MLRKEAPNTPPEKARTALAEFDQLDSEGWEAAIAYMRSRNDARRAKERQRKIADEQVRDRVERNEG